MLTVSYHTSTSSEWCVYRAGLAGVRTVEWPAKAASSKAAEQGHAEAQCELGNAYLTGKGAPESYERAVELILGQATDR